MNNNEKDPNQLTADLGLQNFKTGNRSNMKTVIDLEAKSKSFSRIGHPTTGEDAYGRLRCSKL